MKNFLTGPVGTTGKRKGLPQKRKDAMSGKKKASTDWGAAIDAMRIEEPRWWWRFRYQDKWFMEAVAAAAENPCTTRRPCCGLG